MILGHDKALARVDVDLTRLIESRVLVQANSGGGKSWTLRRLLEQTHGQVQQIVLDVEDEFFTLREGFDYVLAGPGGDCPADVKSAALLARRLLELGVSAIINLFDLPHDDRFQFVKVFLNAMTNAPRELWHPVMVVLDEAHVFAPEVDHPVSKAAVIDLMTRGRKRGFCGVLATQRIAKLSKDAAAEANNKLIGRCSIDVDMARAAKELGFRGDKIESLKTMKPGRFYAFGPAISDEVIEVAIGEVITTHPRAGQRGAPVAPPRKAVKEILGKLADLPREAEAEASTVADLQETVRALRKQLDGLGDGERAALETNLAQARRDHDIVATMGRTRIAELEEKLVAIQGQRDAAGHIPNELVAIAKRLMALTAPLAERYQVSAPAPAIEPRPVVPRERQRCPSCHGSTVVESSGNWRPHKRPGTSVNCEMSRMPYSGPVTSSVGDTVYLARDQPLVIKNIGSHPVTDARAGKGERAFLAALVHLARPLDVGQLATLAGYSARSSTVRGIMADLRKHGFIAEDDGDQITISRDGANAVNGERPLRPDALIGLWADRLKSTGKGLLALANAYPARVTQAQLAEALGCSLTSSTWRGHLAKLRKNGLLAPTPAGWFAASPSLFLTGS